MLILNSEEIKGIAESVYLAMHIGATMGEYKDALIKAIDSANIKKHDEMHEDAMSIHLGKISDDLGNINKKLKEI